jgi:hypothetical protein
MLDHREPRLIDPRRQQQLRARTGGNPKKFRRKRGVSWSACMDDRWRHDRISGGERSGKSEAVGWLEVGGLDEFKIGGIIMEGEEGRGGREAAVVPEMLACLSCIGAAATQETRSRTAAAHGLRPRAIGAPLRRAAQELAEPNLRRARCLFSPLKEASSSAEQQQQQRGGCFPGLVKLALLLFTSAGCLCCAVGYRCQGAAGIKVRRLGGRVVNGRRV